MRVSMQLSYRDGIVPRGSIDAASELDCGVISTASAKGGRAATEDGHVNLHVLSSQLELCDGREPSWQLS